MTNNKNDKKEEMITQSTILEMGWTKAMIKNLLPAPTEVPNPHYKYAAPMKLWSKDLVVKTMSTEEFKIAQEKANKRKKAAKSATKTKIENLKDKMIDIANSINIRVLPDDELVDMVLKEQEQVIKSRMENKVEYYYNHLTADNSYELQELEDELENYTFCRPNNDTLNRWVVNFIRHNLVDYDNVLYKNKGKTGKDEAYPIFKKAVLNKIASVYPKYAEECNSQAENIGLNFYF